MKKIVALFSLVPLLSFGGLADAYLTNGVHSVRVYRYTGPSANSVTYFAPTCDTAEDLVVCWQNTPFGVRVRTDEDSIRNPSSGVSSASLSSFGIDRQIQLFTNGTLRAVFSPMDLSPIYNLYRLSAVLYSQGYRGSGIDILGESGSYTYYNFNYRDAVSDILCSTNTVFRRLLLSHLSTISSSVQNIELNVSGLQSSVDSGNSLLSSVNSNIVFGATNISSSVVDGFHAVSSNLVDISDRIFPDPFVSDFTNAVLKMYDDIGVDWNPGHADYLLRTYSTFDNDVSRALFAREVSDEVRDLGFMHYFNSRFGSSLIDLLGDSGPDSLGSKGSVSRGLAGDVRITKLQLQQWKQQAQQQLQDWKDELHQQLQDWKTSDERGILNIRDSIRDNFSYRNPRPGFTNDLPFTSFVTNYVSIPITNVVRQSSDDISSNVVGQAEQTRKLFDDKLFNPNSDGINVRIKWPLRYESSSQVNVHDQALDDILGNLHDYSTTMSNLVEGALVEFKNNLTSTNSVDWEPWFERWGEYADIVTNFYVQFNSSRPVSDLADRFLSDGFDYEAYAGLSWFSRVELLLAMIASASTNSVDVAEIREEMESQVDYFQSLSTNVVSVSSDVVGLFSYVQQFSASLHSIFGDRAAPLTGDYILLSPGHWIGDEPLVLRINPTIQNLCRLIMQCIWYLGFLVLLWVVVNWCWGKVVAVLRWLWSMFDV